MHEKISGQERQIFAYKQMRDDLQLRKAHMDKLCSSNKPVPPGEEKSFIEEQRGRIADLFKQLEAEKQRKHDLNDRLRAYNEVKAELAKK